MQLHITINGKLIDSIPIDPTERWNKAYLENKKLLLQFKHTAALEQSGAKPEFYTDAFAEETVTVRSGRAAL